MTSKPLTPQLGRIILGQLETPKRESAIVLDGFKNWDAWDRQRLTFFLEALAARGFVARDTAPEGIRTPGPWRVTETGREAATRGDFLADGDARS
jgi:hypothetical protein